MVPNRPPRRPLALFIQVLGLSAILIACTPLEPGDSDLPPVGLEFFTPEIVELISADPTHADGAVIAVLADGRRFVLDAVAEDDGGVLHAAELSATPLTSPPQAHVSLHASQTPIRNQQDRGTCVIHAVAAAMEAQYVRLGFGRHHLSGQYGQHVTKMTSLFDFTQDSAHVRTRDGYENQLALGGGGNIYWRLELLEDYGLPHAAFAPYQHSNSTATYGQYERTNQPGDDPRLAYLFATEEAKTSANVLAPAEQAVRGFLTGFLDTHDGAFGVGAYDLGLSLGAGAYGAMFGALDEITRWGPQP